MAVGARPAEDNAVIHADKVATDAVDPEEETAFGSGSLDARQRPRRRGGSRRRDRPGRVGWWGLGGTGPWWRDRAAGSRSRVAAEPDDAVCLDAGAGFRGTAVGPRVDHGGGLGRTGTAGGPLRRGRRSDRRDLLPGASPGLPRCRVFGDDRQDGLGRRQDRRPLPVGERRVERLNLGGGGLLAGLQFGLGGRHGLLRRDGPGAGGEPLGPVELLMRSAELTTPPFGQRGLPGLGDLPRPAQRRAADLVPRQILNPLQSLGWIAGV